MKTLVLKEIRENLKLAALGVVIHTLLLVVQYRGYVASPASMSQPLAQWDLLFSTLWFCGIFGAVLGWLQIFNERRPDLWAFLLHRPMTRTQLFVGKSLAGMGLYAAVVGLPLAWFTAWALWPGHVAAPFEPRMLRPLAACVLSGMVWYFAGMVTGLRQARWYGSRALALGMALLVVLLTQFRPVWWEGYLVVFIGAAVLIVAAWGGFQTHGYYRGQPMWGKAALTAAIMLGSMIVAVAAAMLLSTLLPNGCRTQSWSYHVMTKDGAVYRVTRGPGESEEITDLEGNPFRDGKTQGEVKLSEFNRLVQRHYAAIDLEERVRWLPWIFDDMASAVNWRASADSLWYYWKRYGRLVGYDLATRRCLGSIGPNGFARDLSGGGERFSNPTWSLGRGLLWTATTLYRPDLERRTARPIFTTTGDDPILASLHIESDEEGFDREYTVVVTERVVHLLTADGAPVWQAPLDAKGKAYGRIQVYALQPAGQYALWLAPSSRENERAGWKLPTRVIWLAGNQGVVRSKDLPALRPASYEPEAAENLTCAVAPPAALLLLPWLTGELGPPRWPPNLWWLSWASAALVCLPIGLWLGRRYRLSFAAQAGWAIFHVLFGVPGLLAFLSVQEWPAREDCPNCRRPRLVDRPQCEHCGAAFAPPEKTGTEVFAPWVATS